MTSMILVGLLAPFALMQAAAAPAPGTTDKLASFAELPAMESAAPRCGVAFAVVEGWQKAGDPRGGDWPDMVEAGGREFFVVAMVRLIDAHGLEREDVQRLVEAEVERHRADNDTAIATMMPACLTLLESSGIKGE